MTLPGPTSEEIALSEELGQKIRKVISQNDGWISFSRYMEMALYEPGLGYYSPGIRKIGKKGDFVTAPEISPLFGQTIALALLPLLSQTESRILELGAGTGRLAHDVLSELHQLGCKPDHYDILELSAGMIKIQKETLRDFPEVRWLDRLPEAFSGVVLGNEVLDAMPVCRIVKRNGIWHELGVGMNGDEFVFMDRPADENLKRQIGKQIRKEADLPDGYMTEVHLYAGAFVRSLAQMLDRGQKGAAVLIDYGYPAREYYLPERGQGTFKTCFRHHLGSDPFQYVGLQDMTAHVDFTMIASEAQACGISVLCYADQAGFLLANGIADRLILSSRETLSYLTKSREMQMLLLPTGMGELFKVMVIGNLELPDHWVAIDRSEKL